MLFSYGGGQQQINIFKICTLFEAPQNPSKEGLSLTRSGFILAEGTFSWLEALAPAANNIYKLLWSKTSREGLRHVAITYVVKRMVLVQIELFSTFTLSWCRE
jgi:hypothetical protein